MDDMKQTSDKPTSSADLSNILKVLRLMMFVQNPLDQGLLLSKTERIAPEFTNPFNLIEPWWGTTDGIL